MSLPFYVSPEQLTADRSEFARAGVAKGRAVIVLGYSGGIAFVTENPSRSLYKIAEIYDRIGFAGVGKYNEFEALRVAGVRYADLRGYSYDRSDVTARGLANAYAQTLGSVFTTEAKPLEVEIAVAEVGAFAEADQVYRIGFDGSVSDESAHIVIGGPAERIGAAVDAGWRPGLELGEALSLAIGALGDPPLERIEAAVLDRAGARRAFRRLNAAELRELTGS
jgi:proteasome alpha subunit